MADQYLALEAFENDRDQQSGSRALPCPHSGGEAEQPGRIDGGSSPKSTPAGVSLHAGQRQPSATNPQNHKRGCVFLRKQPWLASTGNKSGLQP